MFGTQCHGAAPILHHGSQVQKENENHEDKDDLYQRYQTPARVAEA